jgi:LacI family transcriptional regulator
MAKQWRVAIVPNRSEPYDRDVVDGISRFVQETGNWNLYVPIDPNHIAAQLRNWKGDGIIADADDPRIAKIVLDMQIPTVGFGGGAGIRGENVQYMATDDVAIAQLGAQHLLDRGFTNFAFCAMPRALLNQPWSENRAKAFVKTVNDAGYPCDVFQDSDEVARDWGLLLDQLCSWIESLEKPLGLMAAYDVRALHVLEACRVVGACVPEEIAVIGVDNDEQICELAIPPLSSIVQGGKRLGYEAAALLERMMNGEDVPHEPAITVPPVGIVTRQSTDVLAITDPEVATALRYIRHHALDGIRVREVVNQVPISRVSLEVRFKRTLGRTMHSEIQRVQLERVKQLLRSTDLPIREIAHRTGFKYAEYLSNLFHRLTGQTLGQYRSQMVATKDVRI